MSNEVTRGTAPCKGRVSRLLVLTLCLLGVQATATAQDAGTLLREMEVMSRDALAASQAAAEAATVADVKAGVNEVFTAVWEWPAEVTNGKGAVSVPGWKERWQVSGAEFDSAFVERLGSKPPRVTDPRELGIEGRGRAARKQLVEIIESETASQQEKEAAQAVLASLNNVIGWMQIDRGLTKGEWQPRVDLTREWDAPKEFWNSTADTGWLYLVYAQAANILKTDYGDDVAMARAHAADLARLIEHYLNGEDVNQDGKIEPVMMEGGLLAALDNAEAAGITSDR